LGGVQLRQPRCLVRATVEFVEAILGIDQKRDDQLTVAVRRHV
jgi:hypothetical protein